MPLDTRVPSSVVGSRVTITLQEEEAEMVVDDPGIRCAMKSSSGSGRGSGRRGRRKAVVAVAAAGRPRRASGVSSGLISRASSCACGGACVVEGDEACLRLLLRMDDGPDNRAVTAVETVNRLGRS